MQLPLLPNQALYQAEPQPELIRRLPDGFLSAALYFAYFRTYGKRLTNLFDNAARRQQSHDSLFRCHARSTAPFAPSR